MNRVLIYLVLSDAVTSESGEPVRRYTYSPGPEIDFYVDSEFRIFA